MNWKNKKTLITGGAGFIGSNMAEILYGKGAEVVCIDNLFTGRRENLPDDIELLDIDITDADQISKLDGDFDYVFHLAAVAEPRYSVKHPMVSFKTNGMGTLNIIDFSLKTNVKKVVFPSTAAIYGEPQSLPISEDHPLIGKNIYTICKIIGEDLCRYYHDNYGLRVIILKIFNAFGP